MLSRLYRALPVVLAVAFASVAVADDRGRLDSFEFTNTLEWSGDDVQVHVKVTRAADGTYKADVGVGDDAKTGLAVPEEAVANLFKAVRQFRAFPDEGFGGDGAHFKTDVKAAGALPGGKAFSLERHFYDPEDEKAAKLQRALARAVGAFSKDVLEAAKPAPTLESFEYRNVLEWSGDDVQTQVKITRAADGTYKADVGVGESARKGLPVPEKTLAKLVRALQKFEKFPDDSFAGDGAHFYTDVKASIVKDGKTVELSRFFYDPSDDSPARLAGALGAAVESFEKEVRAASPTPGVTGALNQP